MELSNRGWILIAALIAIALTHEPKEDSPYPAVPPRAERLPEEAPDPPEPPPPPSPAEEEEEVE